MFRTIVYLILFILAVVFLFQNGSQPVTLTFLKWSTPQSIPVGFVFIGALLFGAIVVWLWHLPQVILLKGKVKSMNRKITRLVEGIKRKENEVEDLKREKEEIEKKLKELETKFKQTKEEKPIEKKEVEEQEGEIEEEDGGEEVVEKKERRGFFGIFRGRKDEKGGS